MFRMTAELIACTGTIAWTEAAEVAKPAALAAVSMNNRKIRAPRA